MPIPAAAPISLTRLLAILLALVLGGAAAGQTGSATAGSIRGEVDLSVIRFGVDGRPRAGSWFGINVAAKDNGPEPRGVLIQVALRDPDGDRLLSRSYVVLNPGQTQSVWLYSWMPYDVGSGMYTISAWEARETRREGSSGLRYTEERLLGQLSYQPGGGITPSHAGMIGVVGPQMYAHLHGFEPTNNADALPLGHEITQIVDNISPAGMPDRWMGLDPFEAIIWVDATSQGSPTNLTQEQARAIREWVHRGGHLVVVLPQAGQTWVNYPSNPLTDMMPRVALETEVGVDLSAYRPLFMTATHRTRLDNLERPAGQRPWWMGHQVHFLRPLPDAGFGEARRLLNAPSNVEGEEGRCIVAQRLHGRGAVTLIGIDITAGQFRINAAVPTAIESDVWWNRILGRRWELVAPYELKPGQAGGPGLLGMRDSVWVDEGIQREINQTGKAAAGLLLAFVVFAAYWVLAGPVAYLALKQQRLKHHSWLAFVLVGAVFTGVAWGGANLLRPRQVEGRHITILEHVYGQPVQASRSWVSVLLPSYGQTRVALDNAEVAGLEITNAITPWTPAPEMGASSSSSFPDVRTYSVDGLSPNEMEVPTRATVKQFQIDWAGFLNLRMPTPVIAEGETPPPLGSEITAEWRDQPGAGMDVQIRGSIQHQLPASLSEVTIIVVEGQRPYPMPGLPFARAWAVRRPQPWGPGEPLDLGRMFAPPAGATGPRQANDRDARLYLDGLRASGRLSDDAAIALFPLLKPPEPGGNIMRTSSPIFRRQATHGWDVARWFTQPCIIVMGRLDGPLPLPLQIGSAGPESTQQRIDEGRTFIRWIYPLPDRPPSISDATVAEEAEAIENGG